MKIKIKLNLNLINFSQEIGEIRNVKKPPYGLSLMLLVLRWLIFLILHSID